MDDNVGSVRYSGRLLQTTGPDTVKARRPLCREFDWRYNEFVAVRGSETVTRSCVPGPMPSFIDVEP